MYVCGSSCSGCLKLHQVAILCLGVMAKRTSEEMKTKSACGAAPATPPCGERPGCSTLIESTPTKAQKRRKRMQRVAVQKAESTCQNLFSNNQFAFTGGVFSRLDRIEYMLSHLFCSMVQPGFDNCILPEQLFSTTAMSPDVAPFVPSSGATVPAPPEQSLTDAAEHLCGPVSASDEKVVSLSVPECIEQQRPNHTAMNDEHNFLDSCSLGFDEETSEQSAQDNHDQTVDCSASIPPFEEVVSVMYDLCQEEDSHGPYSIMPAASKERVQQIRSMLWDHFEILCKHRGIHPTPESLSSSAGCLPSMYGDSGPDLEAFTKIVEEELAMM
jgi:hypothetical protein